MKYIKAKPISYSPVRRKRGNVLYIPIHWTGNKGDTAIANANYYKNVNKRAAGAHFFIDRSGNIVKSIGMDRTAWAVGGNKWDDCGKTGGGKLHNIANNFNSVSIELCDIVDKYPSKEQIKAVKKCIKYIRRYCRNAKTVIRHFDVTGKHCMPIEDTELLTENGWKYLRDIVKGENVCEYDANTDSLRFAPVLDVVKPHVDEVLTNRYFTATKDHRMYLKPNCANSRKFREVLWGDTLSNSTVYAVKSGAEIETSGLPLSDEELQLLVWVQGDGYYMKNGNGKFYGLEFHVKKRRKIERICDVLERSRIEYRISECANGSVHIRVYDPTIVEWAEQWLSDKMFTYRFLNMNSDQFRVFREEMVQVDGCKSGKNELYTSILPQNLDVVQAICATHGVRTNQVNLGADYRCAVSLHKSNHTFSGRYDTGKHKAVVSCVTVPSGYILVRQNRRTFIVGNCPGSMIDERVWNVFLHDIGEK